MHSFLLPSVPACPHWSTWQRWQGNNFRILGIPLQRGDTLAGISLLTPAVGQPTDVSDLFRVILTALVSRLRDGPLTLDEKAGFRKSWLHCLQANVHLQVLAALSVSVHQKQN